MAADIRILSTPPPSLFIVSYLCLHQSEICGSVLGLFLVALPTASALLPARHHTQSWLFPRNGISFLSAFSPRWDHSLSGYDLGVIAEVVASPNFKTLSNPGDVASGLVVSMFTTGAFFRCRLRWTQW